MVLISGTRIDAKYTCKTRFITNRCMQQTHALTICPQYTLFTPGSCNYSNCNYSNSYHTNPACLQPSRRVNRRTTLAATYWKHEAIKKRAYEHRVREIENSTLTPLVISTTGGLAAETNIFYKRLAACLADKGEQPYPSTIAWLRNRLMFSLLRSSIQCIRGSRSNRGHVLSELLTQLLLFTLFSPFC